MGPIGEQIGTAVSVQMVKSIPDPYGVVILVEVNEGVAGNGHPGDVLLESGNEDEVAVGQDGKIMVAADHGDIASGAGSGGEGGVEVGSGHLPDELSAEVHLL